jgi:hexosaminidase
MEPPIALSSFMKIGGIFYISLLFILNMAISSSQISLWPLPASVTLTSSDSTPLYLLPSFNFVQIQSSVSPLLERAIGRYKNLINVQGSPSKDGLSLCQVNVANVNATANEQLTVSTASDTSYSLKISAPAFSCLISANTIWGALYGLETFSQTLIRQAPVDAGLQDYQYVYCNISGVSGQLSISDFSRFSHRGALIDSSRHYLSIETIKRFVGMNPSL